MVAGIIVIYRWFGCEVRQGIARLKLGWALCVWSCGSVVGLVLSGECYTKKLDEYI